MPVLVKNIEGNVLSNIEGSLYRFPISGEAQREDYINLNGFIAYLQTFRYTDYVEPITKPSNFGLKNQYNLPTVILEISY